MASVFRSSAIFFDAHSLSMTVSVSRTTATTQRVAHARGHVESFVYRTTGIRANQYNLASTCPHCVLTAAIHEGSHDGRPSKMARSAPSPSTRAVKCQTNKFETLIDARACIPMAAAVKQMTGPEANVPALMNAVAAVDRWRLVQATANLMCN
jgi:hypothetical protein